MQNDNKVKKINLRNIAAHEDEVQECPKLFTTTLVSLSEEGKADSDCVSSFDTECLTGKKNSYLLLQNMHDKQIQVKSSIR